MHRRDWIKQFGAGSAALMPGVLAADSVLERTLHDVVGSAVVKPDDRIELHVQQQAANGAVVPVGVESGVPGTLKIVLLANNHPHVKIAELDTSHGMLLPRLSTHLQLSAPATITALVETKSGWHSNSTQVKTLGETCDL